MTRDIPGHRFPPRPAGVGRPPAVPRCPAGPGGGRWPVRREVGFWQRAVARKRGKEGLYGVLETQLNPEFPVVNASALERLLRGRACRPAANKTEI